MSVTPGLRREKQEDWLFKAILSYLICLKPDDLRYWEGGKSLSLFGPAARFGGGSHTRNMVSGKQGVWNDLGWTL